MASRHDARIKRIEKAMNRQNDNRPPYIVVYEDREPPSPLPKWHYRSWSDVPDFQGERIKGYIDFSPEEI